MSKVGIIEFNKLVNGSKLMYNNTNLLSVECGFPSLIDGTSMFSGCESLTTFKGSLGSLKTARDMFHNTSLNVESVEEIERNIASVIDDRDNDGYWTYEMSGQTVVIDHDKRGIITIDSVKLTEGADEETQKLEARAVQNALKLITEKNWYVERNKMEVADNSVPFVYEKSFDFKLDWYNEGMWNTAYEQTITIRTSRYQGYESDEHFATEIDSGELILGNGAMHAICNVITPLRPIKGYFTGNDIASDEEKAQTWINDKTYTDDGSCEGLIQINLDGILTTIKVTTDKEDATCSYVNDTYEGLGSYKIYIDGVHVGGYGIEPNYDVSEVNGYIPDASLWNDNIFVPYNLTITQITADGTMTSDVPLEYPV